MCLRIAGWLVCLYLGLPGGTADAAEQRPPNVVILLADDAGYADFSFQGSREFLTPHIDRIAREGIRFTSGYASGMLCSPARAGLLTGQYQNRFGHEFNVPHFYSEEIGLPTSEVTMADLMRDAGYRNAAFGKWHLGYADHFHPLSRGFDDYYGFLEGSRTYWPIQGNQLNRLLDGRAPVPERFDYMTDELGRAAAEYITNHRDAAFFLYVAFNAVHTPMHAPEEDLSQFPHIADTRRRTLAAMTRAMDRAVGNILDALDAHGLAENSLVIFLGDNGGPIRGNASNNAPLRGAKQHPFEGGIRVPFAMRWPARLPRGVDYHHPVISLDLLPTALAAAGADVKSPKQLDGANLLPYLTGVIMGTPHHTLYWRNGARKAVRDGNLKLVVDGTGAPPMLFDLSQDIGEQTDLAPQRPEDVVRLLTRLAAWEQQLVPPRWPNRPPRPQERRASRREAKTRRSECQWGRRSKGQPAKEPPHRAAIVSDRSLTLPVLRRWPVAAKGRFLTGAALTGWPA
jgi:arylsulfatase A-like enzyme